MRRYFKYGVRSKFRDPPIFNSSEKKKKKVEWLKMGIFSVTFSGIIKSKKINKKLSLEVKSNIKRIINYKPL